MKKIIFICAGFLILFVGLWICIRMYGVFNTYKNVSSANEPNVTINQIVMASNLKEAKRGDLIVARVNGERSIYRLCAIQGDLIEIKRGEPYLNGKMMIQNYDTQHSYNLNNKMYDELISSGKIMAGKNFYTLGDQVHCEFVDAEAKKAGIYQNRQMVMSAYHDEEIEQQWQKKWNADNFGPLTVPKDSYFVLGDNRNNANDSRYIGFIKKRDLLAVVL